MKIKCSYCGSMFNDTMEKCPNCGAPNEGVVRTTKTQPQTIEELAQWYKDRGLPPYETTRFFIGQNYTGKRAFGIYKDQKTGNFVVYKNKDSGQRAIRYEGTDEAYAVNELFMRLKEEIIEQKARNGATPSSPSSSVKGGNYNGKRTYTPPPRKKSFWDWYVNLGCFAAAGVLMSMVAIAVILFVGTFIGISKIIDEPEEGYYKYEDTYMYYADNTYGIDPDGYILYDPENDNWSEVQERKNGPDELKKFKTAQKYYLGEEWKESYGCPNFLKSDDYIDLSHNNSVDYGYYKYDDKNYYHDAYSRDYGWYEYDSTNSWQPIDSSEIPEDLTHYYRAQDFYYTPVWNSDTQITDFKDSDYYVPPSSSSDDNDSSWWDNYYDDSSYDWDYDYDWDS
ncbi:MAG: zinc ribbon domain-containing protein, partial [Eubacterium sp.]|nr:zinc ribbon domain-containing protein [Candidatus Colimonas fimequi]